MGLDNRSILVVDDDPAIQEFVSMALNNEGYHVLTASNGVEALERVEQCAPALILLDVRMPKMDGPTFIQRYQSRTPAPAPIVVLTAGRNSPVIDSQQVTEFMAKPFDLDDLLALIERYVSR